MKKIKLAGLFATIIAGIITLSSPGLYANDGGPENGNAENGGANGAGGFTRYRRYNTPVKKLRACANMLSLEIELLSAKYGKLKTVLPTPAHQTGFSFSLEMLQQLVREIKFEPNARKQRTNPDGEPDELAYDYIIGKNPAIFALKPAFDEFELSINSFKSKRRMIHEALHIFGYDEHQSADLSRELAIELVLYSDESNYPSYVHYGSSRISYEEARSIENKYNAVERMQCKGLYINDVSE